MKQFYLFILLFFFYSAASSANNIQNRDDFIRAYQQIKQGKMHDPALTSELRNYILYPYLEHAFIKKNINTVKDAELIIFLKRFPNSVLAKDIRDEWIKRLAERRNWERVLNYHIEESGKLQSRCFYTEALIRTGQAQRGFQQGKKIWLEKSSAPDECNGLFNALGGYKQLSAEDYWQRIALLMDKNKVSAAGRLAVHLSPADQKIFADWKKMRSAPEKQLSRYRAKKSMKADTPHTRKVITYGVKRLAKKKQAKAENLWRQLKLSYRFTEKEAGDAESYLYYRAARNHDVRALPKLQQIPAHARSKEASLWMARIALRTGNWKSVLNAIHSMSPELQKDGAWIYWKAKALEQLGDAGQAKQLLSQNAKNATFYGFLSADRLQQPYHILNQPVANRFAQIEKVKKLIGIRRALELFAIGETQLASKEWFHAVARLNKQDKLAAAELALQNNQAFTGILTVSKTKDWNVVDLRFPLMYRQLVTKNAQQQGIDPAWVYGVMRRESAFKVDALSRVKAFGLMQLMPATARSVARSLGLKGMKKSDFVKPDVNVQLGSRYLAQMLKRFNGSYPKATAAYNAGPGRIPRWTPANKMSADQWIESIPFNETRKYVRGVLAYATIYDHKLRNGQGKRLSQRLSPILPQ